MDKPAPLFFLLSQKETPFAQWEAQDAQGRRRLSPIGWISDGSAQDPGPGAGGPCAQWTRKVKGKTLSGVLSKEQSQRLHAAIAQWREGQATLKEMPRLSRRVLFETLPHPPRR